ncbi:MAG: DUF6252 family protein [Parafilimonas sp.]
MTNKILFLALFLCNLFYGCKKHTTVPANPVDQLPPATQVGANTFGCLVDGQVVVIHKPLFDLSPDYNCFYQLIYNSTTGYVFYLSATDKTDGCHFKEVGIRLDSLALEEMTYPLNTLQVKGGRSGIFSISNSCSLPVTGYYTDNTVTGELTITHFDQQQQIVSGTFYFNAIEQTTGDTVHVTNGRFDMHYTD